MRGVGPNSWELRPQLQIVEGRKFNPGLRELVVGEGAKRQYVGLDVGKQLDLANQAWTIVGAFRPAIRTTPNSGPTRRR